MIRRIGIIGILLLCIFAGYMLFLERTWLGISVQGEHGQQYVQMLYLPQESRFCVRFKHSVALTPVEEWFVADAGKISLQSTVYEDFGAGLPHDVEKGQKMNVQDGKIIITGYTLKMPDMYVRVGRVAEHTLIIEKNNIKTYSLALKNLAKPGRALKFSLQKASLIYKIWHYWKILKI